MSLRSPIRLLIRIVIFLSAWVGALFAWRIRSGLFSLKISGVPFMVFLWLLMLLDLILAFFDHGRWYGFPDSEVSYSPEDLSLIRKKDRRLVIRILLLWALLLTGGISLIAWTPLGSEAVVLAVVSLLPLEAVFVRWRCPFRAFFTHSRCCRTCRLRDWGEAMVLSPLLAVPSAFSIGLFTLSLVLLARGEILRYGRPYLLDPAVDEICNCSTCTQRCSNR